MISVRSDTGTVYPDAHIREAMDDESDTDPVVAVDDLWYTYPGADHPAVRGVSFTINAGEIVGFLGPSGPVEAPPRTF